MPETNAASEMDATAAEDALSKLLGEDEETEEASEGVETEEASEGAETEEASEEEEEEEAAEDEEAEAAKAKAPEAKAPEPISDADRQAWLQERQQIQAERQQLNEAFTLISSILEGDDGPSVMEIAELARTKPEEAFQLRMAREAKAAQMEQVRKAQGEILRRQQAELARQQGEVQARENAALLEAFPDLRDEAKAKSQIEVWVHAAEKAGFTAEDLRGITDHRLVRLLDLAAEGLRLSQKKPVPAKKGTGVVIAPGVRSSKSSAKAEQISQRFAKSRSLDDATDALLASLK